jgi:hypothetical protein
MKVLVDAVSRLLRSPKILEVSAARVSSPNSKEHFMETIGHENGWGDGKYVNGKCIQDHLSVSRTKAYEIICEIAEWSPECDAVIKFSRCLRVRRDVFLRWAFDHGIGGTPPEL